LHARRRAPVFVPTLHKELPHQQAVVLLGLQIAQSAARKLLGQACIDV
jgi:hypothetical protein